MPVVVAVVIWALPRPIGRLPMPAHVLSAILGPLVAAAGAAARRGGRLRCPDEAADERALDFLGERIDVEAFAGKKSPRVFDGVDTCRLDADAIEAGLRELR